MKSEFLLRKFPLPFMIALAGAAGCSSESSELPRPDEHDEEAKDDPAAPVLEVALDDQDRLFLESDDDNATEIPFEDMNLEGTLLPSASQEPISVGETKATFLPLVAIGAYELAMVAGAAAAAGSAYYMRTHDTGDFSGVLGRFSFRGRGVTVPSSGTTRGRALIKVTDTQLQKTFSYRPRYVARGTSDASSIVFAKARNAPAWAKAFEDTFAKAKRAGKTCGKSQWDQLSEKIHNLCDQARSCSSVNTCAAAQHRSRVGRLCAEARKIRSVRCAGYDQDPESHADEVANAYKVMMGCLSKQCTLCTSGPGDYCPN